MRKHIGFVCIAAIAAVAIAGIMIKQPEAGQIKGISISNASSSAQVSPGKTEDHAPAIKVDVSGAVMNPGVKELQDGDRVEDAIKAAGGFAPDADANFVASSINLAEKAQDGGKIFIPSRQQAQETMAPAAAKVSGPSTSSTATGKISINRATADQLDSLPGIGETYAQRIVANRPYSSLDQLCTKPIFRSKSTCDKIKPLITL